LRVAGAPLRAIEGPWRIGPVKQEEHMPGAIVILGVFVADAAYRADRMPRIGETLLGNSFALGPGGKGSNQAVAAARAGAKTHFLTKLGRDTFADMAFRIWEDAGVTPAVTQHDDQPTGSAFIFVEETTGNNAIIICPGVAGTISPADIDGWAEEIAHASVFVTQLEQPMDAAMRALEIARRAGVTTVLNTAPAADLPDGMLELCDYVTPNEHEAEGLTGIPVKTLDDARKAADRLIADGAGAAILTLGENGALYHDGNQSVHVPIFDAGPVRETTGAGDAFNGGFAAALTRGLTPVDAVRFGCATAAISVTRPGTAASMPRLDEIEALLAKG
jgi:ribokinase